MADPTPGEVNRRLDDRITDVRDDIAQLGRRVDAKIDEGLYEVKHQALVKELADLKADLARERVKREQEALRNAARAAATRRWLIGTVIVPIVAVLLAYLLTVGGKG